MTKEPQEFPIFRRDGRTYSFLDCICDGICKERDCIYCAFEEIQKGDCPGAA